MVMGIAAQWSGALETLLGSQGMGQGELPLGRRREAWKVPACSGWAGSSARLLFSDVLTTYLATIYGLNKTGKVEG